MKTPQPRQLPGARRVPSGGAPGPLSVQARRAASVPPADMAAEVERLVREAYRAGFADGAAAPVPEAERALLADIATALSEGGELGLSQPMGPCPGMPWQMSIDGRAVLDGEFAALFPDVAVQGLVARDALRLAEDGRAVPGPRLVDASLPGPSVPGR